MTLEEDCKEVLRHELSASELLGDMVDTHSYEDIDTALMKVGGELVSNANDPQRKKSILIIIARLGQSMESREVVSFAKEHLEEWQAKYE